MIWTDTIEYQNIIRHKCDISEKSLHTWDVSGFVRLFYILSKNKIFRNCFDKYSIFLANNIVISINYYNFFFKIFIFRRNQE